MTYKEAPFQRVVVLRTAEVRPDGTLTEPLVIGEFITRDDASKWLLRQASYEGNHILCNHRVARQYKHFYKDTWTEYENHTQHDTH
jgi:hypothetical protein